jgi:hypothetical protein
LSAAGRGCIRSLVVVGGPPFQAFSCTFEIDIEV